MVKYDKQRNILTLQQREFPTNLSSNVLESIKSSYYDYLNVNSEGNNIAKDINYLVQLCVDKTEWHSNPIAEVRVGRLISHGHAYGLKNNDMYYPVYFKLRGTGKYASEDDVSREFELLRLPYMDERGILNMETKLKTMSNFLTASEDVSFEKKADGSAKLDIFLGSINQSISITKTCRITAHNNSGADVNLDDIVMAYMAAEQCNRDGVVTIPNKEIMDNMSIIHNAILTYKSKAGPFYSYTTARANADAFRKLWYADAYKVSKTARNNINHLLQLDRAVGKTLSRPVMDDKGNVLLPAETRLTQDNIDMLKRHCVWHIYVHAKPYLTGMKLSSPILAPLRVGQVVNPLISAVLGHAQNGSLIVRDGIDFNLEGEETEETIDALMDEFERKCIVISGKMSEKHAEYFASQPDIEKITVDKAINGEKDPVEVYLDIEIVTNKTFYGRDIGEDDDCWYVFNKQGELVKQEECLDRGCYYREQLKVEGSTNNNEEVFYHQGNLLTSDDLLAFYSVCGWYISNPEDRSILNKDTAFLKTISLFADTWSRAMRKGAQDFVAAKSRALKKAVENFDYPTSDNPFTSFPGFVTEALSKAKALETANTLNPISVLANVSNASTFCSSKNSVVEGQRLIALPFYGRICPYETPASAKIGLVNHLANGCVVVNGRLLTPFRMVQIDGNGRRYIDFDDPKSVKFFDAKEQTKYRITDCLSIPLVDANGKPVDVCKGKCYVGYGRVPAFIPNSKATEDVMIPETVYSDTIDLIYYSPEQHCSTTALLMPFLGADDPARISFGLSMQKQAIYCQENEIPRVLTHQYEDIFKQMGYYVVRSKGDGIVEAITNEYISIQYFVKTDAISNGRRKTYRVNPDELRDSGTELEGMTFKAGGLIVSTLMKPISEDLAAEFDCKVISMNKDTGEIEVEEIATTGGKGEKIPCKPLIISGEAATFMEYDVVVGQHVVKGQVLAHASIVRDGFYAPSRNVLVAYVPTGYNYEDAVDMSRECAAHYTSISASSIDIHLSKQRANFIPSSSFVHENGVLGTYVPRSNVNVTNLAKGVNNTITYPTETATNISGYYYMHRDTSSARSESSHFNVTMLSFNNEKPGDKMAGRHGNKGVDSRLAENSKTLMLKNGKIIDVCLNPCGVPSRMNLGQNLEAHLGFIAEVLNLYIMSDPFNGATLDEIREMMEFTHKICNSDTSEWQSICRSNGMPDGLYEHLMENVDHILDWKGVFNPDGTAEVWNPDTQRWNAYPVTIGYAYFMKLEQEVDTKVHARAGMGIEDYAANSLQPQQGRSRGGGQKMGEMELVTLAGYGAVETLREDMNEKSDNVGLRTKIALESRGRTTGIVGYDEEPTTKDVVNFNARDCTPRANDVLRYLLEGLGIETEVELEGYDNEIDANIAPIDKYDIEKRERLSNRNIPNRMLKEVKEQDDKNEDNANKSIGRFGNRIGKGGNKSNSSVSNKEGVTN